MFKMPGTFSSSSLSRSRSQCHNKGMEKGTKPFEYGGVCCAPSVLQELWAYEEAQTAGRSPIESRLVHVKHIGEPGSE